MNLTDFTPNPIDNNGTQVLLDFKKYELSIIKSDFSYGGKQGLYEIGVWAVGDYGINMVELEGITSPGDTVKGYLTEAKVNDIIKSMSDLTKETPKQI